MTDENDDPIYTGAASRLEVLLDLLRADCDTLEFGDGQIQISLTQSVDSLVENMQYEECVWARLQGYGVAIAPLEEINSSWHATGAEPDLNADNRTDHRADNVEHDFEKDLNVVRTPRNWAQRDATDHDDNPYATPAVIIGQFDRAGSDDLLTVYFDPRPPNANYHVDWEDGTGVAHAHAAETRQELRGTISAMTHMVNHHYKRTD